MRHYFWVVKNEYASVYYTSVGTSILERRKSLYKGTEVQNIMAYLGE